MSELVRRIYKQGIIILLPVAVISAFFEWKKLPISILLGGALGFANLKGLEWGLERIFVTYRPRGKLIFLSFFRFFILACILLILAILKLVNLFGILIGFTVVFILILKEGLLAATRESSNKK
jgi:hypothetical protein